MEPQALPPCWGTCAGAVPAVIFLRHPQVFESLLPSHLSPG